MTKQKVPTCPTDASLREWIQGARPGSHYIYHVGYLPRDRGHPHVRGAARLALELAEKGALDLAHQRLGMMSYSYRATKRSAVQQ